VNAPPVARSRTLRDARLALPLALVLLLAVSSFTLFSYRSGVDLLIGERQQEALRAADAAARLPVAELQASAPTRFHPAALRVVRLDGAGRVVTQVGATLPGAFADPFGGELPSEPRATGPGPALPGEVAALRPLGAGQGWLRLDLAAPLLAGQRRTASLLRWVGLGTGSAVLVWVLLFLRQLLLPYEALLARARALDPGEDEGALLRSTVERALAERTAGGPELAALERTLAPSLESGLLLLDREGRTLALNPAGATLLRVTARPRAPLEELLSAQLELYAVVAESVASGQGAQRRECALRFGADERRLGLTVTPLRRGAGEVLGFLVLFADLGSAREAQQDRLAESLAQLGELAAGVAHELRNGLATLAGWLAMVERDPAAPAAREHLRELRQETRHLERVVADFLAFARPETARPTAVDLGQVCRQSAADPALPEGAVVVTVADGGPPPLLTGDPELLVRALRNLLRNAVEAHSRAGVADPVELRAGWVEPGGTYRIEVGDRGEGVSPDLRARLFQPFASDRPGGVGLGLALAHRIISLHGGRLTLEGREGGGTSARVEFPPGALGPSS
jgi:signal transduction histidine kinase